MNTKINSIIQDLKSLTLLEAAELIKEIEYDPPNSFRNLRTRIVGKEKDTIYWRTNKGDKIVDIGIYSHSTGKIIDGLDIRSNFLISVHTKYKNSKREGVQKVFYEGKLLAEQTFVNNVIVLEKSINPFDKKMVEINFKDGEPYTGRLFQFDQFQDYYNEFIYEEGVVLIKNHYEIVKKELKLNLEKSYKLEK